MCAIACINCVACKFDAQHVTFLRSFVITTHDDVTGTQVPIDLLVILGWVPSVPNRSDGKLGANARKIPCTDARTAQTGTVNNIHNNNSCTINI